VSSSSPSCTPSSAPPKSACPRTRSRLSCDTFPSSLRPIRSLTLCTRQPARRPHQLASPRATPAACARVSLASRTHQQRTALERQQRQRAQCKPPAQTQRRGPSAPLCAAAPPALAPGPQTPPKPPQVPRRSPRPSQRRSWAQGTPNTSSGAR
jgi:hypothetical protein